MCTRPQTKDGKTFACRNCNACIKNRRGQWEARAMMERQMHPHTLCLGLTYNDETEHNRDAAQFFQYLDVRQFFARLRERINALKLDSRIKFIVAGEQGDRNGRCHWHMIIYSQVDLTKIGEFKRMLSGVKQVVTDRKVMISEHRKKPIRLDWDVWGHGFVTLQEPDQGGMHYVLSYCLADQFIEDKSKGTAREAKAANFSTGLFRMSKRPPIGYSWLWQKLAVLDNKGAVLPCLKFQIPGYRGYYVPSGTTREMILWTLRAINQRNLWATGRNCPQWSSLLAEVQEFESEREILNVSFKKQREELEYEFRFLGSENLEARRQTGYDNAKKRGCVGALPCNACLETLPDENLKTLGVDRKWAFEGASAVYILRPAEGFESIETRQKRDTGNINPWCRRRGVKIAGNIPKFKPVKGKRHLQTASK